MLMILKLRQLASMSRLVTQISATGSEKWAMNNQLANLPKDDDHLPEMQEFEY